MLALGALAAALCLSTAAALENHAAWTPPLVRTAVHLTAVPVRSQF
jgi:hypothetical protein